MGFFAKSSLVFVAVNVLRLLSVIAIVMTFAGQIVVMDHDLKGYKSVRDASSSSTAVSTASASPSTASEALAGAYSAGPGINTSHRVKREYSSDLLVQGIPLSATPTATRARSSPSPTAAVAASSNNSADESSSIGVDESTCAYYGDTSVPRTVGGILFSTLHRIFCCLVLLFMLVSEMPPPFAAIERFWTYAFPPLGESFGTGVLGVVQVFIGCSTLSHALSGFPQVAGWFLFILGFLNMLFGLAFGASIKSIRSILSTPTKPSGLRSLKMAQKQEGGSYYAHHDVERVDEREGGATAGAKKGKKYEGKRGIQISAPMIQVPEPPIYR